MARGGVKTCVSVPSDPGSQDDRPRRLFDENLGLIQQLLASVARQHRLSTEDAEDFVSSSILKIIESDYRIFASYRGESNLRTFLLVVFERMCLDFRIAQWGKWRPSAGSRRGGSMAMLLERLTMRDGLTFGEACAWLETNHRVTLQQDTLWTIFTSFRRRGRPRNVGEQELVDLPAPPCRSAGSFEGALQTQIVDRAITALDAEMKALTPRDRLLLQLRYADGLHVSAIARMLHLRQPWLYRHYEKLNADLQRQLMAAGVVRDELCNALGEGEMPSARIFTRPGVHVLRPAEDRPAASTA